MEPNRVPRPTIATAALRSGAIWIVGADHWPRALLRAELIERGYDATGFVTLRDALVTLVTTHERPALIAIDLRGAAPTDRRLEALFAAGTPTVAVGGTATWQDPKLRALPWTAALRLPLTLGAIADQIARLIPSSP